jgi:hypothetical protein
MNRPVIDLTFTRRGLRAAAGGFGSLRITTLVNLVTMAEIAPTAARSGARMAPTAATVTGISTKVLPCSWI